jgi:hypothetical protein
MSEILQQWQQRRAAKRQRVNRPRKVSREGARPLLLKSQLLPHQKQTFRKAT